ncbi:uncharacterized protein M421DRAFT_100978 [Didymella exigua CBS 183.55]|uniref:Peptide N-acetyl-beta-D-glucosaminyl asparaginase amidase A N-terminal domain-containing protein n=1 Tax=Didymella exigua CBS 183.55 TaxID=1150837 RepID=A0A6A5RLP1_9PLEO|nr:uncharacterized protein M421DRAFT_100978 [Didymella exigua CBS 183.55]KAF1928702.1 hypothetical protein M421DRAFT_100978 [Didymella exigua CBS 183.55]
MGGNLENVAGYGQLSLGQAVNIAQNSEGGVDQRLAQFLERRLADVWAKLNTQPTSYILPADEFALLNYYRPRFGDSSISSQLECLQVAPPIAVPPAACQQPLMVHNFAHSHGRPYIGEHYPPDCEYNCVVFNVTVTLAGRQFNQLALMLFDDVGIFRTWTAAPTQDSIVWRYPRKIIFDLGNLVDDTYTGAWHTTLTAAYFTAVKEPESADIMLLVSARRSPANRPSYFTVPESKAVDALTIPQNTRKSNISNLSLWTGHRRRSVTTIHSYGHSPFRELQLLIDGQLGGVARPFPVMFTGGVVPGFWRPITGIDAFDLVDDEIDITPFLPILVDDKGHTFEIRLVVIEDDGKGHGELTQSIESNWVIAGQLFVWLDTNTSIVTGSRPIVHTPKPSINVFSKTSNTDGTVASIEYYIQVTRNIAYSNYGTLSNSGSDQNVEQNISGLNTSPVSAYPKGFAYPSWAASIYDAPLGGGLTIDATTRRGKTVEQIGELAFYNEWRSVAPRDTSFYRSKVTNSQNGTASYISIPAENQSYGSGSTEQHYMLSAVQQLNRSIVVNEERSGREEERTADLSVTQDWMHGNRWHDFAVRGIEALPGRGPH